MGNNYIFVFDVRLVRRPNSAGRLFIDLLGTADSRERELQARLPFCFQDQLTLKWLLQSPFYRHFFFFFLPSLSVQALESNTHMVLWLGCF